MKKSKRHIEEKLSRGKRILFSLISILIPFLLLLLIEIILRLAGYGERYKLYTEFEKDGKKYYRMNEHIGSKYFSNISYKQAQSRLFLKEKPENTTRIFVLGSSTVVGFPYPANISFPSQLERMLQQSLPDQQVEVINTSITAINSYSLLDFAKMLPEYDPDYLLLYAGHNEFYGALGMSSADAVGQSRWYKLTYLKLKKLRIFQWIDSIRKPKTGEPENAKQPALKTLMERVVSDAEIEFNGPEFRKTSIHYQKNIEQILNTCKKNNIPVIVSDLVCNVKDLPPFNPVKTDGYPLADAVYATAQKKYKAGLIQQAKEDFLYAKDLDGIRFRAPEVFNEIIVGLAEENKVPMVEMRTLFEEHAKNGIIGDELMTEHVHPSSYGYHLMARGFYKEIATGFNISGFEQLSEEDLNKCFSNTQCTAYDSAFASLILTSLKSGWPFKKDKGINTFIDTYQPTNLIDSLAHATIRLRDGNAIGRHQLLAETFEAHGNFLQAGHEYWAMAQTLDASTPIYHKAASLFQSADKPDQAIELLTECYFRFRQAKTQLLIADANIKNKKHPQAIESLKAYLKLVKDNSETYEGLIRLYSIYQEQDDQVNKTKYLNMIRQIRPDFAEKDQDVQLVRLSEKNSKKQKQARQLLREQKPEEALKILNEINAEEENMLTTALIGQIKYRYKHQDAYIFLEKVFASNQQDPELMKAVIISNFRAGNKKRAREVFEVLKTEFTNYPDLAKIEDYIRN